MPLTLEALNKIIAEVLNECCYVRGMSATKLSQSIENKLLPIDGAKEINVILKDKSLIRFIAFQDHDKTILTSITILSSHVKRRFDLDLLPEILIELSRQNIQFNALQFPHVFVLKEKETSTVIRSHFNQILLFKNADQQLIATVIDSTANPFGISNTVPPLGWLKSNSISWDKELVQNKLIRLLNNPNAVQPVIVSNPLYTKQQPISGDGRCGAYVFAGMASLMPYLTSAEELTLDGIIRVTHQAHQLVATSVGHEIEKKQ